MLRPYVNGFKVTIDKAALRRVFVVDPTVKYPIGFFVKTEPYKMWGIFTLEHKLIGPLDQNNPMYLLGADRLGRDLFSRIVYGTRISMSIGLIGVALSLFLGVVLGGISGYYGGRVDHVIQRVIEFILSLPTTPALARAGGSAALQLAAAADLSLHHHHPLALSAGPISPGWCAAASCRCARRIS